ncbi:MAG TPA: hypothetical protein VGO94_09345 [Mycobacteriales bacterium]|nr:hypothetical protein [Mycobacteriales bacterium]
MPSPAPLPRRALLRLAGRSAGVVVLASSAGALVSCTGRDSAPEPDRATEALAALWAGERALVARYRQTHARFPALRPVLGGVLADHVAHAAALRAALDRAPAASTASPAPGTSPSARPVPATAAAALADLVRAETAAAAAASHACLLAGGDTAALLASVAACEASHLVVLR